MSTKDGGPVHPLTDSVDGKLVTFKGISLRDHFAGLAMQGIVACGKRWPGETTPPEIAALAYRLADAMLKEREK